MPDHGSRNTLIRDSKASKQVHGWAVDLIQAAPTLLVYLRIPRKAYAGVTVICVFQFFEVTTIHLLIMIAMQ